MTAAATCATRAVAPNPRTDDRRRWRCPRRESLLSESTVAQGLAAVLPEPAWEAQETLGVLRETGVVSREPRPVSRSMGREARHPRRGTRQPWAQRGGNTFWISLVTMAPPKARLRQLPARVFVARARGAA